MWIVGNALKKIYLGKGSHLDPPNIYTMVTPLGGTNTFTFTFMHLADAFIQSDLHFIQVSTFYQLLLSLGIEPMILALLVPCSTSWATGKPVIPSHPDCTTTEQQWRSSYCLSLSIYVFTRWNSQSTIILLWKIMLGETFNSWCVCHITSADIPYHSNRSVSNSSAHTWVFSVGFGGNVAWLLLLAATYTACVFFNQVLFYLKVK